MAEEKKKKRFNPSDAWREARELVIAHRWRLLLGLTMMIVNRLVGLVLPASTKFLIDDVIGKHRADLSFRGAVNACIGPPLFPVIQIRLRLFQALEA